MKVDKTYGIRFVNDEWKIGNKVVQFNGDNIIIGDTEYNGTPGLWELLTSVNPDPKIFNNTDHVDYKKILIETSAMKQNYDPTSSRPASSKSEKWKNFVSPIWDEYKRTALKHQHKSEVHQHKSDDLPARPADLKVEDDDEFKDVT